MIPLFLLFQAAPSAATPPWSVVTRADPATGTTATTSAITSREGNARLVVKCDAGAVKVASVQFISDVALGAPADRPVSLAADAQTPLIANWEFTQRGAFIREAVAVTTLAATIGHARTIRIHTRTNTGDSVDATFDGPPGDAPIRQVLAACGYPYDAPPVRQTQSPPDPAQTTADDDQ